MSPVPCISHHLFVAAAGHASPSRPANRRPAARERREEKPSACPPEWFPGNETPEPRSAHAWLLPAIAAQT